MSKKQSLLESLLTCGIAFTPILIFWYIKEFLYNRPYWVFYDHIETLYYYTSIELTEGGTPHNVDNPGTLVQLVGTILIKIIGSTPENYPLFQQASHFVILLLSFLTSVLLIRLTLNKTNRIINITAIWAYFSFLVSLTYLHVWGPESFYYIVGLISLSCLFWCLKTPDNINNTKAFLLGCSIGLLLTVKFVFLAWLPALCLIIFFPSLKNGFFSAVSKVLISLLGVSSSFLIITFCIKERYSYMFSWVLQNITNEGAYGRGEITAIPSLDTALNNWADFLLSSKIWLLFIVLILILNLYKAIQIKTLNPSESQRIKLLMLFSVVSIIFSILFVSRSYIPRYMLPVGLCGVIIYIVFLQIHLNIKTQYQYAICGLCLLLLLKSMNNDFSTHVARIKGANVLSTTIEKKLDSLALQYKIDKPIIIYGWRYPSPVFALRQHALLEEHQQRVDALYPRHGHHTPWPTKHRFRLPKNTSEWHFAVIRDEFLNNFPKNSFEVLAEVNNYNVIINREIQ